MRTKLPLFYSLLLLPAVLHAADIAVATAPDVALHVGLSKVF